MEHKELTPDCWVVIRINNTEPAHYRLLIGFEEKDEYKVSTKIESCEAVKKDYVFTTDAVKYFCNDKNRGLTPVIDHVYLSMVDSDQHDITIVRNDEDFSLLHYME
jgi:hypothetical protein